MMKRIPDRLFSAAITPIVVSESQTFSGHTAAGLPPNGLSVNASILSIGGRDLLSTRCECQWLASFLFTTDR